MVFTIKIAYVCVSMVLWVANSSKLMNEYTAEQSSPTTVREKWKKDGEKERKKGN